MPRPPFQQFSEHEQADLREYPRHYQEFLQLSTIPSDAHYELKIKASDLHGTSRTSQSSSRIISPTPHAYRMLTSILPCPLWHRQACAARTSNVDRVGRAARVSTMQYYGKLYHTCLLGSIGLMIIFPPPSQSLVGSLLYPLLNISLSLEHGTIGPCGLQVPSAWFPFISRCYRLGMISTLLYLTISRPLYSL